MSDVSQVVKPHVSGDLVDLVKRMRVQQRIYFTGGPPSPLKALALKEAKKLEKEVDQFIALYDQAMTEYEKAYPPIGDGSAQPSLLDVLGG